MGGLCRCCPPRRPQIEKQRKSDSRARPSKWLISNQNVTKKASFRLLLGAFLLLSSHFEG